MFIVMLRWLVEIMISLLVFAFSTLIHETGHMIGYRLFTKKNKWTIQVGIGKQLFQAGRFHFHVFPVFGFFHLPTETSFKSKKHLLLMYAGGPAFTLLLALALFGLHAVIPADVSSNLDNYRAISKSMGTYNIYMFLWTIIPMRYPVFFGLGRDALSDGKRILNLLRSS